MSFVVGLTGGIGSGKTTVADLFAARGAAIVDTDLIAHALTGAGGEAIPAIRDAFGAGAGVLAADGRLDRAAMRALAFADPSARARLEAILHPLIREQSERECQAASTAPYVLLVVPLLIESPVFRARVDRILVVDCDEAVQRRRVMARSGLGEDEVQAIMDVQATRAERLAAADDVVNNDVDHDAEAPVLVQQVEVLHAQYLALAKTRTIAGELNANR